MIQILNTYPDAQKDILLLLRQIETGIPLNALYLDLTNDEKISNEADIPLNEVLQMIRQILQTTDADLCDAMIETLISSEPFSIYTEEIRKAYKEGKIV